MKDPYLIQEPVTYIASGPEVEVARACMRRNYPIMLRGPTGCGKTTLARYLAHEQSLPLVGLTCTEDTDPADFVGRQTLTGWIDGRATAALRYENGAMLYLDEIGEARQDAIVIVHSLTDDRRELENPILGEILRAPDNFTVIASYNPTYQVQDKLKPSTMQRFVTIDINFPEQEYEVEMVKAFLNREYSVPKAKPIKSTKKSTDLLSILVAIASDFRSMAKSREAGLREGPGTRLIGRTAGLIDEGIDLSTAIQVGMINPLTHKEEVKSALYEVVKSKIRI